MQNKKYTRLADQERESISRGLAQHKSIRQLAKELNRSPSTISREIRRNRGKSGYRAFLASRRAEATALAKTIEVQKEIDALYPQVEENLISF